MLQKGEDCRLGRRLNLTCIFQVERDRLSADGLDLRRRQHLIAIIALYIFASIGTLSGCGIVIGGVGDA